MGAERLPRRGGERKMEQRGCRVATQDKKKKVEEDEAGEDEAGEDKAGEDEAVEDEAGEDSER